MNVQILWNFWYRLIWVRRFKFWKRGDNLPLPQKKHFRKSWKFRKILRKIKKMQTCLSENMLTSGHFNTTLYKIWANFQLPPSKAKHSALYTYETSLFSLTWQISHLSFFFVFFPITNSSQLQTPLGSNPPPSKSSLMKSVNYNYTFSLGPWKYTSLNFSTKT